MLILINSEVIDVFDPSETLRAGGVDPARAPLQPAKIVRLGQDAAFAAAGIESAHEGIRRTLAALLGMSAEANCALFLVPPNARSARDVAVRLAMAPITTLAHLKGLQEQGLLTPGVVNRHVWRLAAGDAAA